MSVVWILIAVAIVDKGETWQIKYDTEVYSTADQCAAVRAEVISKLRESREFRRVEARCDRKKVQ